MRPDELLKTLEQAGFEACFVGGCVRDTLLGRPVHDWDIATSALPEQMMALFPGCIPTGLKHGTVTVLLNGESFEVTTFEKTARITTPATRTRSRLCRGWKKTWRGETSQSTPWRCI